MVGRCGEAPLVPPYVNSDSRISVAISERDGTMPAVSNRSESSDSIEYQL